MRRRAVEHVRELPIRIEAGIVASTAAKLSLRFVKMGLVPELASSHFVPQRVGFGAASDLMLSGRTVEAPEALALR